MQPEISVIIKSPTEKTYGKVFHEELGQILTQVRKKQNLRLESLSKELNITMKTLEEVELGRRTFHPGAISKLLTRYKRHIKISLIDENN